jgi:hypothetical protein
VVVAVRHAVDAGLIATKTVGINLYAKGTLHKEFVGVLVLS